LDPEALEGLRRLRHLLAVGLRPHQHADLHGVPPAAAAAMSERCCSPRQPIFPTAAYADAFASPIVGPVPVTARTRPPAVTRRPRSSSATPAPKTVTPSMASASSIPVMTSPVRGDSG